ncbi:MAG: hypothetical protein E7070_05095 [Bacteroidales bacterium]|nr:hypothetical protein [Bacteroidales bacterium]
MLEPLISINIKSPEYVRRKPDGTVEHEKIELHGFSCPVCHGSGWTFEGDSHGELFKRQCECCMGFGLLKARVSVEWLPDERAKQIEN